MRIDTTEILIIGADPPDRSLPVFTSAGQAGSDYRERAISALFDW